MQYYTYAHYTPAGKIFYIGKGQKNRYQQVASGRSTYWHDFVLVNCGFTAKILAYWPTENDALSHESFLISCFRDMGVELINRTSGGQRGNHSAISEKTRTKMINAQQLINTKRKTDTVWDAKIFKARSNATKNRIEGYQAASGKVFKEKFKNDLEYAKKISENRKRANIKSVKARQLQKIDLVNLVRKLRSENKSYQNIVEITGYSMGMVSNIITGKAYAEIS